jgi:nucleotide-binding universal stress UspA family protein
MTESARSAPLRILVGIDLSERGRTAFLRAVGLAKSGGSLSLVHVTSDAFPQKLVAAHDSHARDALEELVLRARADGVGQVSQTIAYGRDYEQLIEQARKGRADLIVLGRHRSSSVLGDLLGTTVDRVLRLGGVPVLTVKENPEQPYNSILVAVDFSAASKHALACAVRWFPQARITAVTAYGTPRHSLLAGGGARRSEAETHRLALKGFLDEVAQSLGPDYAATMAGVAPVVEHGWAEDVILRAVDKEKPDLLVVGTHARSGIGHSVVGSVAEWVLLEAACDVLATPPATVGAELGGENPTRN